MLNKEFLQFLYELSQNNNRDWFEKNKVLPAEFKEAAKKEPFLANKQFYFMAELDSENCLRPDFRDFVEEYFSAGKGLNEYLRKAIGV